MAKLKIEPKMQKKSEAELAREAAEATEKATRIVAEEMVRDFEAKREEWQEAQDRFKTEFPDADEALNHIKTLEDETRDLVESAKALVAAARTSIGDFKVQLPKSTPNYDGMSVLEILAKLENHSAGETFKILVEAGFLKKVAVDEAVAKLMTARDAGLKKLIKAAWRDSEELTPRVTVPKL